MKNPLTYYHIQYGFLHVWFLLFYSLDNTDLGINFKAWCIILQMSLYRAGS